MASKKSSAKPTLAQAYKTAQKSTAAKPKVDIPKPIKDTAKDIGSVVSKTGKGIGSITLGNVGDALGAPFSLLLAADDNTPIGFFSANTGKGKKATSIGGKIADVGIGDVVSGVGKGVKAVGKAVYNAKVGKKVIKPAPKKPAPKKSMPKVKKK